MIRHAVNVVVPVGIAVALGLALGLGPIGITINAVLGIGGCYVVDRLLGVRRG